MGSSKSVQTIFAQHFQHIGKLFNFLEKPLLHLSVPQNVWHTQITVILTPKVDQKNVQILKKFIFLQNHPCIYLFICNPTPHQP